MYAIASGLIGFRNSALRVRVTDIRNGYAWVVTADLLDAGTKLVLLESQVEPETPATVQFHRDGLVAFA